MHAVVVGAGPAGALTALLLAQQGFRVSVFEKRLPEEAGGAQGRSGAAGGAGGAGAAAAAASSAAAAAAAAAQQMARSTIGLRTYNGAQHFLVGTSACSMHCFHRTAPSPWNSDDGRERAGRGCQKASDVRRPN